MRQVQDWLSDCVSKHSVCNENWRRATPCPIRLLNVKTTKTRLETFGPGRWPEKYVTLSHRWGSTSEEALSRLTEDNLRRLMTGFSESSLPLKFQNAAHIARWMDVEYVWIDALCIVQDSEHDWREQSHAMGDIYAGSHCNIAAMYQSGNGGFLRKRNLEIVEPYLVPDPRSDLVECTHVIGYDDFWCNSLLRESLHNRAWVLQERQMSPRTIHFGEQIFWECREHKACEAYPTGIPHELTNWRTTAWGQGKQVFDPKSKKQSAWKSPLAAVMSYFFPQRDTADGMAMKEAYKYWSATVERYMECDLSNPKDKLMAIQGLANKVREATGDRYVAGLWDSPELAQSLLWFTPSKQQGNGQASERSPARGKPGYRAPSWSWASFDGKIVWNWPAENGQQLLQVQTSSQKVRQDMVHGVEQSAEMRVTGKPMAVQLQVMNSNEDGTPQEDGCYAVLPKEDVYEEELLEVLNDALSRSDATILLDEALAPTCEIDVHLLPVVTEWRGRRRQPAAEMAGLILRKDGSLFERIGVFCFDTIFGDGGGPGETGGGPMKEAFAQLASVSITLI
jgi:hypothetical protein